MNFYERAKKLREKYNSQLATFSLEREAKLKLQILSQLVARAFYTDPLSFSKNPDELPLLFYIDMSRFYFSESLVNDVFKDLGYDNVFVKINPTADQSQPREMFVTFNR